MTDATTTEAPKAAAKKAAKPKKSAAKKAAAERASKVSAAGAKAKAAAKKADEKKAKAISAGRKVKDEPKPRNLLGHPLDAKITYGTGPDGKKYSQANCPKRAGTGAEKEWRKYANAKMTIQGAMDAGIPRTFVLHDIRYGYMEVAK